MSTKTPTDVIGHYASRIPEGVAESARLYGSKKRQTSYPSTLAALKPCDGFQLGDTSYVFEKVSSRDGVVVTVSGESDSYWAMEDGLVQSCLRRLVTATDLVVLRGDDDYLPPQEDECGVEDGRRKAIVDEALR